MIEDSAPKIYEYFTTGRQYIYIIRMHVESSRKCTVLPQGAGATVTAIYFWTARVRSGARGLYELLRALEPSSVCGGK
jgi:hypothetical protein